MANPNISAALTPAQKTTCKQNIAATAAILNFITSLTPKQRRTFFKMGQKSVSFVQYALQIAQNNPQIIPPGFSVTEFAKDVALSSDLLDLETVIIPLAEGISDTLLQVGSEAMAEANQVYAQVKIAAKTDANMKTLALQLGERYKGQGKKKTTSPNPAK